ncbi:hypothetical protein Bca101_074456 [Brassica carinata]
MVSLSNCQGLPNSRCPACIGTTSHFTWSWYLPIQKGTTPCSEILSSVSSLSHLSLYGLGCGDFASPNLSTRYLLATLVQEPPSIIRLHTLPSTLHLVWKMFSRWTDSGSKRALRARLTTSSSPVSA